MVGIGGDRYILREATDYDALGNGAHDHPFWPFGGGLDAKREGMHAESPSRAILSKRGRNDV